jgi:hypothetical protein
MPGAQKSQVGDESGVERTTKRATGPTACSYAGVRLFTSASPSVTRAETRHGNHHLVAYSAGKMRRCMRQGGGASASKEQQPQVTASAARLFLHTCAGD